MRRGGANRTNIGAKQWSGNAGVNNTSRRPAVPVERFRIPERDSPADFGSEYPQDPSSLLSMLSRQPRRIGEDEEGVSQPAAEVQIPISSEGSAALAKKAAETKERYSWFAQTRADALSKASIVTWTILGIVAAWYPYGVTTVGIVVTHPLLMWIVPAAFTIGYMLSLGFTLADGALFQSELRWIFGGAEGFRFYVADRFYGVFTSIMGIVVNFMLFLGWLTWWIINWGVDTKTEFLAESGKYVTEPYAALSLAGVIAYLGLLALNLGAAMYTNVASRHNQDLLNIHLAQAHSTNLVDSVVAYNRIAVREK